MKTSCLLLQQWFSFRNEHEIWQQEDTESTELLLAAPCLGWHKLSRCFIQSDGGDDFHQETGENRHRQAMDTVAAGWKGLPLRALGRSWQTSWSAGSELSPQWVRPLRARPGQRCSFAIWCVHRRVSGRFFRSSAVLVARERACVCLWRQRLSSSPLRSWPPSSLPSYRTEHPEARGHLSEALTEDTGVGTSVAGSPLPLTTGNDSLDITIVKHLQYCTQLIQVLGPSSFRARIWKNIIFPVGTGGHTARGTSRLARSGLLVGAQGRGSRHLGVKVMLEMTSVVSVPACLGAELMCKTTGHFASLKWCRGGSPCSGLQKSAGFAGRSSMRSVPG